MIKKVRIQTLVFVAVVVIAIVFRAWGTFDVLQYVGDESIDIPAAKDYFKNGLGNWKYSYMKSIIFAFDIAVFGDNPVGWRIDNVVLGSLSVVLVYLIAQILFKNINISLLSASMLAFDPFSIHFSRTAFAEVPVLFFFLLYVYLLLEYCENRRSTLLGAGIALGLTVATNAYFVLAIPLVGGYAYMRVLQQGNSRAISLCLEFAVKLVLLPLTIYLLSHILWFGRGHTFGEFLLLKSDSIWIHNNYFTFINSDILRQGGKPWEWFIRAFSFGHQLSQNGQYGRFTLEINNPLIRLLVLPSFAFVTWHAITTRSIRNLFTPVLFVSCYVLFFLVARTVNSYSALVLLPFAYIMVAQSINMLSRRYNCEPDVTSVSFCIIFIIGLYLFPLSAGFQVPIDWYLPIIKHSDIMKVY